jgi:hypothetical protein
MIDEDDCGVTGGMKIGRGNRTGYPLGHGHTNNIYCSKSATNEAQEIRTMELNEKGHTEQ